MPNQYHRPTPGSEKTKTGTLVAENEEAQSPSSAAKDSSSSSSDSSDSGIASGSEPSPERKKKKSFLPFRFRSYHKTRASQLGEGAPSDVLEVWFAGCHSGQWVHYN